MSLTLDHGEIAVVLGAPDSGKTLLLEVAAGLTRPSAGLVRAKGGTASLIHPRAGLRNALTGPENIVRRARAEGLSKSEARARADLVVQFAELDDVSDVPVAKYSEERVVRLAFGTMVLLGARVLIWDDVLLSRHPTFRQKCLAHIPTLLREGKAILIATDDVGKTGEIGPRAVWLDQGRVRMDGPSSDVLARYLEARVSTISPDPPGVFVGPSRLSSVQMLDEHGQPATRYLPGDPITVAVELELEQRVELPYFVLSIAGESGPITAASMFLDGHRPASIEHLCRLECTFEGLVLAPGHTFTIRFAVYASDGRTILHPKRVIASFVTGGSAAGCGFVGETAEGRILGAPPVLGNYSWRLPDGVEKRFGPGLD